MEYQITSINNGLMFIKMVMWLLICTLLMSMLCIYDLKQDIKILNISINENYTISENLLNDMFTRLYNIEENLIESKTNIENLNDNIKKLHIKRIRKMKITGYIPNNTKTSLGKQIIIGKTAAISNKCIDWLNRKVFVRGLGTFVIEDLTAKYADNNSDMCILDIAVPNKEYANKITSNNKDVVCID